MLELDLYISAFTFSCREEIIFVEVHHASNNVCWESLNLGVEITDIAVVEAARCLDLVFSVRDFILELQEVLTSFQIRVIFSNGE